MLVLQSKNGYGQKDNNMARAKCVTQVQKAREHPSVLLPTGSTRQKLTFIQCPLLDAKGPGASLRFASNWLRQAEPKNLTFIQCPLVGGEGPGVSLSFASDWLHKAKANLYSVPIIGADKPGSIPQCCVRLAPQGNT